MRCLQTFVRFVTGPCKLLKARALYNAVLKFLPSVMDQECPRENNLILWTEMWIACLQGRRDATLIFSCPLSASKIMNTNACIMLNE